MRKPIFVDPNAPTSVESRLGSGVQAWVFGSVAKGKTHPKSDLDVYISGPCAKKVEAKFFLTRPPAIFEGKVYPLHVIGPSIVSENDFLEVQPEARRIL